MTKPRLGEGRRRQNRGLSLCDLFMIYALLNAKHEMNIEALREEATQSARKLFCLAESALVNFPTLRKVVLMKRTPRFDLTEDDPLGLKPQLSSLADSVSFSYWCESRFRNKIVLGGHTVPQGESQHSVYGVPGSKGYDGIHMRGPSGRHFLTESILKVLVKANLANSNCLAKNVQNNSLNRKPRNAHERPHIQKSTSHYDAMGIMVERIRSCSQPPTKQSQVQSEDDVFLHPVGRRKPLRSSVIKGTLQHSENQFSVPVSNRFEALGN